MIRFEPKTEEEIQKEINEAFDRMDRGETHFVSSEEAEAILEKRKQEVREKHKNKNQ